MRTSDLPIRRSRAAMGLGVALALSASSASAIPYGCNPNALAAGEEFIGMAPGGPGIAPTPLCIFNEPPAAQGNPQGPPPRQYTREEVEAADRAIGEARTERAERAQAHTREIFSRVLGGLRAGRKGGAVRSDFRGSDRFATALRAANGHRPCHDDVHRPCDSLSSGWRWRSGAPLVAAG